MCINKLWTKVQDLWGGVIAQWPEKTKTKPVPWNSTYDYPSRVWEGLFNIYIYYFIVILPHTFWYSKPFVGNLPVCLAFYGNSSAALGKCSMRMRVLPVSGCFAFLHITQVGNGNRSSYILHLCLWMLLYIYWLPTGLEIYRRVVPYVSDEIPGSRHTGVRRANWMPHRFRRGQKESNGFRWVQKEADGFKCVQKESAGFRHFQK